MTSQCADVLSVLFWQGIRSGPLVKTAADHTSVRSLSTEHYAIQPPPLPAMNGVAGSGSFIPQEPGSP